MLKLKILTVLIKCAKDKWKEESVKNNFRNDYTMQQLNSFKLCFEYYFTLKIMIWTKITAIIYIYYIEIESDLLKAFN